MRHIIALTGRQGAGKSKVVARHLVEQYGWIRTRFSDPLKMMLKSLGLNDEEIDGDLKEAPCALLGGKTPRWGLQSLGEEWGRKLIDRYIWVNKWRDSLPPSSNIVVDDLRYHEEAEAVHSLGGHIVSIDRPGSSSYPNHKSESQIIKADIVLTNDRDINWLTHQVDDLIRDLSWVRRKS